MNAPVNAQRGLLLLAVSVVLAGCTSSETAGPTPSPAAVPDHVEVNEAPHPLERGTYYVAADGDRSELRVNLTIPADGWSPPMGNWRGVAKETGGDAGDLLVTITTVDNVAAHGCTSDAPADPPIGNSVGDLAEALVALPPFEVTSEPTAVTAYGFEGVYLELTVPDELDMTACHEGNVFSWIEAGHEDPGPFFGYGLSGTEEEIWLLDVDGTTLMIAAMRRPGATPEDLAELDAIVDSIRIEA